MTDDRGRLRGLASLAWLVSATVPDGALPDGSDDLLALLLGRDLGDATFRLALYGAVVAAILAAIIVALT